MKSYETTPRTMISRIVVPVDFSGPSRLALRYAVALARKFRARLMLLHVVETGNPTSVTPTIEGKITREHMQQARKMLHALVSTRDQGEVGVRILVRCGELPDSILSAVQEERANLVVMGTHGRNLFSRALMGSVAEHLLKRCDVPVLTVAHVGRRPAFERILFAADLSEASKQAVGLIADLAHTTHAEVIATHAADVGVEGGAEAAVYLGQNRVNEARSRLSEMMAQTFGQRARIDVRLAEVSVADTILRAAEDHSADLIVLALQKDGETKGASLNSTSDRIIREATIPVLSIPVAAPVRTRAPRSRVA